MAKSEIEKSIQKCKKCKKKTVHVRTAKRMTLSGFVVHLVLTIFTGGLYLLFLIPGLLFGKKGEWTCEECI